MTKSTVAQNITDLIDTWEELADDPTELLFSKTFYHDLLIVADKVTDAIEAGKPLDKWQKATIVNFNTFLGTANIEVSLMRGYYPTQCSQLQRATTASSTGQYNLHDIALAAQSMLAEIRRPTYLTNLCQELERVCTTALPNTKENIVALVHMLLVRMVEQASSKMLEKHGPDVISRTFLEMHAAELATALQQPAVTQAFTVLVEQLSSGFKMFIEASAASGQVSSGERAANLAKHLIENDWETSSRIGVYFLRRMFDGVVFPQAIVQELFDASAKGKKEQRSLISKCASDPFWLNVGEQWFDEFAEQAILFLTRFFLEASSPQHPAQPSEVQWLLDYQQSISPVHETWKQYSEAIADSLVSTHLFADFETELPPEFQSKSRLTQRHSAKQAIKRVSDHHLPFNLALEMGTTCSVNITGRQKQSAIQQMIRVMVRELLGYLKTATDHGEVDSSRLSSFDLTTVLDVLAAQRRIVVQLRQWLEVIAERFITSSRLIDAQKRIAFLAGDIPTLEAAFHQQMVRRITEAFGGSYAPHLVDGIQPAEVGRVVHSLADIFTTPQSRYQVTGIVDGLDLKGRTIQIGTVRLYDARVWDYGEANNLDTYDFHAYRGDVERYAPLASSPLTQILNASSEYKGLYGHASNEFVRHSARATVTVEAFDSRMAQELAMIEMQQVLDTLIWSQTRGRESGLGHKFELLPPYAVIVANRQSMQIITDDGYPRLATLNVEGDQFEQIARTYHKLLGLPLASQTPVETAVLRALHWLSRGYWETYPPDKFLNYWIAIEQLLVQPGQSKLGGVQSRLPELVATWFHNNEGQEVLNAWRELLKEIEKNPHLKQQIEADVILVDWNISAAVLLRNLSTVEQMDTTQVLSSIARLKTLMDKARITAIQIDQQEKLRYKIELLNRRRNMIVHEGFSYSTDIKHFTGALWEVSNRAVTRVLDRIGAKPGHYQTVDDVIQDYQIPF
jgi:hypothetical protein